MYLRLEIKVVPASGKSGCILDKNQRIKCYLKSQAEDGKANKELIKYMAELFNIKQQDVEIVVGFTHRNKILSIKTSYTYEQFLQLIGSARQSSLF